MSLPPLLGKLGKLVPTRNDSSLPGAAKPPDGLPTSLPELDVEAQRSNDKHPTSLYFARTSHLSTHFPRAWTGSSETFDREVLHGDTHEQAPGLPNSRMSYSGDILLSLPPPPAYDVVVHNISIAIPPSRASIPTPIPIPIPQWVTGMFHKWRRDRSGQDEALHDAVGGLIVRSVNAVVNSGEVMAIIGGSGSGKTTLLHAIASRLGNLPIAEGHVSITPSSSGARQGYAHPRSDERRLKGISDGIGFVRQHDYLLPHLTVRETLTYAAKLRLPTSVDTRTRGLIVEQTIQELGLSEAANVVVGGLGRKGISGGEKRRLSIGCVLVSFPSVLVLDEVTTGLDSFTAHQLLVTLDRLAKRGRTIILSIHQPRSDAFALFSRILLLSHGSVVYSGPSCDCLPYFSLLGFKPQKQTNPLDFLVDISSIDSRDKLQEDDSRECVGRLVQCWREKEVMDAKKRMRDSLTPLKVADIREFPIRVTGNAVTISGEKRPGLPRQIVILTSRSSRNMVRGHPELIGHILPAIVLGILLGIIYFQLGGQPNDIQSLKTLSLQVAPVYDYVIQTIWTYKWCTSLVVFDREREDSLYSPVAWLSAEFLAWLPMNVFAPSLFSIFVYFICNLRMDDVSYNFGVFIANVILIQLCFIAWALLAASVERSFARAALLGNALAIFFVLSPGYFVVNVPGWIRWFRWISPHFFSFRVMILSQFRHRSFSCDGVTGPALAQCSGDNVLRGLRISPQEPIWPLLLGNLGFFVVVIVLACVILNFWKPGGVLHAQRITTPTKAKGTTEATIDISRAKVVVTAENVGLRYVQRTLPSFQHEETTILTDVSARFPSGEVSVIIGPSGTGKSTFLRMCAGQPFNGGLLSSFKSHGSIMFNDVPVSGHTKHVCAFVEQDDDYHLPALTVRETLRYAAIIKLPSTFSRGQKVARAEEVMRMLGLRSCADVLVGGELLKGISGGEKRRLSLACQMINDPAVLIVDEPTSGLDANTARNVMEALRDIARSGRTVIASLHQPRSDIYNMADNLMILAKRGNVIFEGPREKLIAHLSSAGYECPSTFTPSDYCMDLISVDVKNIVSHQQSSARVNALIDHWKYRRRPRLTATAATTPGPLDIRNTQSTQLHAECTPIWVALPVVLGRMLRNTWRQPDLFWTRWIQAPVLALCFFLFFLRLPHGPDGAQDRIGLVAECTSSVTFVGFLNLVAIYPMEKTAFFHDYTSAGGRYSTATFITAFSAFALIPELVSALLFALLMNVATGMRTSGRIYFEFAVSIWVQLNFGESVGIAFASFFDTMGLSVSVVAVFLTAGASASSVLSASIPKFIADIAWAFPMKYSARIELINEMRGMVFDCTAESITSGECTAATGQQVLDLFGFDDTTWHLTLIAIAVTVAYRVFAWMILALRMRWL